MKPINYCIYAALAVMFCFLTSEKLSSQIDLTSGTSWEVPPGVYCIQVECWGAGGNGGRSVNAGRACAGGGGGAYAMRVFAVSPGQVFNYSIGTGGAGTGGANHGGSTWFSSNTVLLAEGGRGVANSSRAAVLGGQASNSIGDVTWNGGNGGMGGNVDNGDGSHDGGGGGGAAGATGNGMNGGPGWNSAPTAGTNGYRQGGSAGAGYPYASPNTGRGGNGSDNGGAGGTGVLYGSGGGGAKRCQLCVSNENGGNGRDGIIRITILLQTPTSVSASTTICSGNSTTLSVSGGVIGTGTVQWYSTSCGVGSVGSGASLSVSPSVTTTYFARYESSCSNTACLSTTITVDQTSTPITTLSNPGTICPNTNTSLTASGGVAGTGSTVNWYTGPNGTGSLVGTGTIVTVAPTTNTTYYVRREGTCNTTADASVTINLKNYVYAATGTTSNTYCTDNAGWNHFYVGDDIIFSAQGDFSMAPAGYPVVTINDNGAYYQETQGPGTAAGCASNQQPGEERFEMERSWNVDMGGGAPIGTYDIRFYYQPAERTAIEAAAAAWMAAYPACGYAYKYNPGANGFFWFKNSASNYVGPMYENTQYPATVASTANGVNYAQWTGLPGFSGGSGAVILLPIDVLPVELTSFTALCNSTNDEVSVRWTTASEYNSSHFNVERSVNGSSWDLLTTTNAAGNSTTTQVYEVKDYDVRGYETIYYRLQQYDQDGSSKQYGPVSVSCSDDQNSWMVFPNPAGNEVTILLKGQHDSESTQISITDINGKEIQTISYDQQQGQLITVDLRSYATGVYVVLLMTSDSKVQMVRLIKQ